jgi:hypothetical protein
MTRADAIQGAIMHAREPAVPEYGRRLQFWYEVQEAFDYVNARKALMVAGANWRVERQSAAEIVITINVMQGPA